MPSAARIHGAARALGLGAAILAQLALACSSDSTSGRRDDAAGSGGTETLGSGGSTSSGTGGTVTIITEHGTDTDAVDASADADAEPKRPKRCDDAGNCTCMNIMSYGRLAHYGSGSDNTDAFIAWLNSESSAHVDVITTHETLTQEMLDNYDVVILQALEDAEGGPYWQFTSDEISALESWVRAGGGLIAMTGYGNATGEVDPTNRLLAFSDISYSKTPDQIDYECPSQYNGLCYCWSNTIPVTDWRSDGVCSSISAHLREIGIFAGRPIKAPSDASVCATDGTYDIAVAKAVDAGHVFAFADEWVTYTSQWHPSPDAGVGASIGTADPYNPCWLADAGALRTANVEFQIPQFWYNVINWASSASCPFAFNPNTEPDVIEDVH